MAKKCPNNSCPWRERTLGVCIAPVDERLRRKCPLAEEDAKMTDGEAMAYIMERYPEQGDIWKDYMKRRDLMKVGNVR